MKNRYSFFLQLFCIAFLSTLWLTRWDESVGRTTEFDRGPRPSFGGDGLRTGSTMGGFGRKKGRKSHLAYQNPDTISPWSSVGKALANLVILRLLHSTVTFTETLKPSTPWWDRPTNEGQKVISRLQARLLKQSGSLAGRRFHGSLAAIKVVGAGKLALCEVLAQ